MTDLEYIAANLSDEDILCQIAEEASELSKAALKLRRVITGTNPTPVTQEEAIDNLIEEYADTIGAFWVLDAKSDGVLNVGADIAEIIFDVRKETNPCSLCSKMRRGALNTVLINNGCNKLALGHHKDDVIETFFLSMIFEGRLNTFAPKNFMSRSRISLIRPMVYIEEKDIAAYATQQNLPVAFNPCPADKHTQRQSMKELIKNICVDNPFAKDRIGAAITCYDRYNLWDNVEEKYKKEQEESTNKYKLLQRY